MLNPYSTIIKKPGGGPWKKGGICPADVTAAAGQGRVGPGHEPFSGAERRVYQQHRKRQQSSVHDGVLLYMILFGNHADGFFRFRRAQSEKALLSL